jgi:uncharacterized protein (DUF2147 family)
MQGPSMKSVKMLFFCLTALACLSLAPPARAQAAPQGWWLDQTGRAGILIAPCGSQICGRIEWLKAPLDPQNKPKTDIHNPEAALQSRPLCGLPLLGGFTPDGSGGWTGGWVYDPESGKTYKGQIHAAADGTLHLRGYIGIPMLGRTEVWTRPAAALTQCSATP